MVMRSPWSPASWSSSRLQGSTRPPITWKTRCLGSGEDGWLPAMRRRARGRRRDLQRRRGGSDRQRACRVISCYSKAPDRRIPPVRADATILIVPASIPDEYLAGYLGSYRLLLADFVVVTMCEEPFGSSSKISSLLTLIEESWDPSTEGKVDGGRPRWSEQFSVLPQPDRLQEHGFSSPQRLLRWWGTP